jgi:CO dehydrogenase/acetyl-CoA synthase alpha subunit
MKKTLNELKQAMIASEQNLAIELNKLTASERNELLSYDHDSLSSDDLDYLAQQAIESLTIVI